MTVIFRVKHGATTLDFGSRQAANQLLDNYPPHIREKTSLAEITGEECRKSIAQYMGLVQQNVRHDADGDPIITEHLAWLQSRLEMYEKALPSIEQAEALLRAKVENLPTWDPSQGIPSVNEVFRP